MSGLLSSQSKSRRPKFLFYLQVNELVNIPQTSGYCYVKWNIRDGTGSNKNSTSLVGDDKQYKVSNQSKGLTSRVKVTHHRAQWNYKLDRPIQLKLQVDRNKNIHRKDLVLDIYFEFINDNNPTTTTSTTNSNGNGGNVTNNLQEKISNKIQLGRVIINLTEYIREDEMPITNRFLLKNSKVNSIINVTLQMKLIRGTYTDFNLMHLGNGNSIFTNNNSIKNGSGPSSNSKNKIQPLTLLDTHGTSDLSGTTSSSSPRKSSHSSNGMSPLTPDGIIGGGPLTLKSGQSSTTKGLSTISTSMNPLVDSLYAKTFHLPWDPRPNELSPRECVEDIVKGGDGWAKNENGINLIDLQALRLHELELAYYASHSMDPTDYSNSNMIIDPGNSNSNKMDNPTEEYWDSMDRREFMERRQEVTTSLANATSSQNDNHRSSAKKSELQSGCGYNKSSNDTKDISTARDTRSWSISHVMS
ncbi:similar to Saccharomyces cerevisiae YBL086C Protein of unknown function [Maudiozyma saulgeensis]|uniref:C2 NT-type domain-containing protein n=1 Tax=Maudiozyma saulgeensis TaxID=1789683 RepID=A0A1X7R6I6_9SACH|nr:similar to Saccharomyces cerevisiae YBL086C Protein of unknown function [Kazachstania saulgeensis]